MVFGRGNRRFRGERLPGFDILSHEYFGIDTEIIWDLMETRLGELEQATRRLVLEQESGHSETEAGAPLSSSLLRPANTPKSMC